jgi:hypothetical protein
MKKKLRTWLPAVISAFPTAFGPYRRVLQLGRMKKFLAAIVIPGQSPVRGHDQRQVYNPGAIA